MEAGAYLLTVGEVRLPLPGLTEPQARFATFASDLWSAAPAIMALHSGLTLNMCV